MEGNNKSMPAIQSYAVKSKSQPGKYHMVEVLESGKLLCSQRTGKIDGKDFVDCIASIYNRPCAHRKIIENYLNKKNGVKK
jgi:hypothetical protein